MFCSRSVSRVFPRGIDFAGYLKMSNINIEAWFWDLVSFGYHAFEMLETSALGLGQDLGLLSVSDFVRYESSISPETIFKPTGSAGPKFRSVRFRRSEEVILEASLATSRDANGCFFLTADLFSKFENVFADKR
ncbi:hypothetical protein F2Q69_00042736 [Brassica cretica]|uniref:Uncharacterized protein n=1 Tax=Brassica cretica TaxID=69181 RepID=A0A8S9NSR7_BRACR|nr:hypothetical protein F2Q69_00042736 [Brassica cretica]